ncbi:MAG: DUF1501 domain-containing protein [Planctomycetes bacterium]|nr:DUF1501 domain-containing protein [Planctomycetota bacterium]
MLRPILDVSVSRKGVVNRRGFMKRIGGGMAVGGAMTVGWRDMMMAQAAELQKRGKSMILLWMDGGPSQYETFNPKIGSKYQGPAKAISTNIPGLTIADFWPQIAQKMDKIALIRSMVSSEAEHERAIKLVRTGYLPNVSIRYPTFGSVVARERDNPQFDLPAFIRIGKPRIITRDVDSGVLGSKYSAFKISRTGTLPPNVLPNVPADVLRRRLALAESLDQEFANSGGEREVRQKKAIYDRTARFVLSPRLNVFDLDKEPQKLRDAYGDSNFGQGCLLARRLVERGVSFVEVLSTGDRNDAGWDTHGKGFRDTPYLSAEVDPAYTTLLSDLEDRGMLENTLVVWMGEFGRTPKIKTDGGRDHYSTGWITALSGGGVKTGQVIGATDRDGLEVTDRPVSVQDLFMSFCHVLAIEPDKEYRTNDDRPIKLVEGGEVIKELFA